MSSMRRPRLPRLAIGVISLFLGFTPLFLALLWYGDAMPGVVSKLLMGFGLVVAGILFALAERFSLVRTTSGLTQLFPEPEPQPEPFSLQAAGEALKEGAAVVLPASIGAAAVDLAKEQAQDTATDLVKNTFL